MARCTWSGEEWKDGHGRPKRPAPTQLCKLGNALAGGIPSNLESERRKYAEHSDDYELIKIDKTVYDAPESSDGKRVLVMSLWPRGISKQKVDLWMKDLGTPRETIGRWKSGRITWNEFAKEYRGSLRGKEQTLKKLSDESKAETITLLCTEKDPTRCHRSILKEILEHI